MAHDPYTSATSDIDYYSLSGSTEPDMRQEFARFLDGSWPEVAKRQKGLLRQARRAASGKPLRCPCVDDLTKEPDKDIFCPICYGSSYYWDEEYIWYYKTLEGTDSSVALSPELEKPGLIDGKIVVFYIRYNTGVSEDDRIIEIALDTSGTPISPVRRTGVYRIGRLWEYRSDNGKLEYYKVFAFKENVKYLNAPTTGLI